MAAIQLPDGQQVHGGGEHPHPCRAGDWVQIDIARLQARKDNVLQDPLQNGMPN